MTPADKRVAVLRAELERNWGSVERHLGEVESIAEPASGPELAYVALGLDHAYQAWEAFILRCVEYLDEHRPRGDGWHVALLAQAELEIRGVRPALVPRAASPHWHALRRFRHFLRHAYAVQLDRGELLRNREHLRKAVEATRGVVEQILGDFDPTT